MTSLMPDTGIGNPQRQPQSTARVEKRTAAGKKAKQPAEHQYILVPFPFLTRQYVAAVPLFAETLSFFGRS